MAVTYMMAGRSVDNASLYRRLGVSLGDPAVWIDAGSRRIAMVRDLEMDRTRAAGRVDEVTTPAKYEPPSGLSGDRETAMAQAAANLLRKLRRDTVTVDRTLPFIYAWHLDQAEIEVRYDAELGVRDRRQKSAAEIESLRAAQSVTEDVMRLLCTRIARAGVNDHGELMHEGEVLTSDHIRRAAAIEFMSRSFSMSHGAICASVPQAGDCHHAGEGTLRTGVPIILDLFPRDDASLYWGDCTRTVVHGTINERVARMHAAVVAAKRAATAALVPGATGEAVHRASTDVLIEAGYVESRGTITDGASIQHGTGHGIGLELHEPILLDNGGGEILSGEVFTVEPGLYGRDDGGVRVEDMIVATADGPMNLNRLPEGLDWS